MRILLVIFWMWQAQEKKNERKRRRKSRMPCSLVLGHAVNNCMTVIDEMGRYPRLWEIGRVR